ncbi:MAG: serpin family protein, partial [Elusimicrobiota bacterium]
MQKLKLSIKFTVLLLAIIQLSFAKSLLAELDKDYITNLSSANNDFAVKLFSGITDEGKNTFISPYSIHSALLLAYIGSDGQTKEEMKEVLAVYDIDEDKLKEKALALKNRIENASDQTEVSIANALFLREDVPFLSKYKKDAEKYFQGKLAPLPEKGETVNNWVKEKTQGKIEEIIPPGGFHIDTIACLVNAIYFSSTWQMPFDEEKTTKRTFYGTQEKEIDMMQNRAAYRYAISKNMKSVTIEYKDGDYLFHAFMPAEGSLPGFYKNVNREFLKQAKPTNKGEIILRMPKFALEFTREGFS